MSPNGRIALLNLSDFAAVHESAIGTKRTIAALQQFVRYWGHSGQKWILACNGLSANDPTATLVVHCGKGFDASFSPYQSTRLSRYNSAS
jgi:hypothetical protein